VNEQTAVLDEGVLAELRESVGGDEAFVKELVDAYLTESPAYLEAVRAAAAANDTAAAVRPAHTLKSSSAAIGAMRVSLLAKRIEHAAREGQIDHAAISDMATAWSATVDALAEAGLA
jgi:HPt (histidine-containing phosphotransfer) domain-containing protein